MWLAGAATQGAGAVKAACWNKGVPGGVQFCCLAQDKQDSFPNTGAPEQALCSALNVEEDVSRKTHPCTFFFSYFKMEKLTEEKNTLNE